MDLQILISQKGTKVVTATNLYTVLDLPDHHYAGNVKKWINDIYQFSDGIRKPQPLKDYAKRQLKDNAILKDFYLSLEFAKQIVLKSNSKHKLKYAQWLDLKVEKGRLDNLVTPEEVTTAMELAQAMRFEEYQKACERQHLKTYESRNGGSAANWWRHRFQLLGYDQKTLIEKMSSIGKTPKSKSARAMLMQLDQYELIRTGVIDLLMALGKSDRYAKKMGDLTKQIAKKMEISLQVEKAKENNLQPMVNSYLLNKLLERVQVEKMAKRA